MCFEERRTKKRAPTKRLLAVPGQVRAQKQTHTNYHLCVGFPDRAARRMRTRGSLLVPDAPVAAMDAALRSPASALHLDAAVDVSQTAWVAATRALAPDLRRDAAAANVPAEAVRVWLVRTTSTMVDADPAVHTVHVAPVTIGGPAEWWAPACPVRSCSI
jgi:hypothetical protein